MSLCYTVCRSDINSNDGDFINSSGWVSEYKIKWHFYLVSIQISHMGYEIWMYLVNLIYES